MSDTGSHFVSEKFELFCINLSIEKAILLSYHHLNTRQVEVCIIKHTIKKCINTKEDIHVTFIADESNTTRSRTAEPCYTAV